SCIPLGVSESDMLFGVSSLANPFDLYSCRLDGSAEKRLTSINQELISSWKLPSVEHLQFEGSDGVPVEGWMLLPAGQKPPYPTILYIHGGPHSAFGHMFSFDFQMLAGAGYGVLFINHRASLGYGDSFSTAIKGDWGNLDYHDLMNGVDCAIRQGLADPDRLGCCGLSGGGNLSCWIVGHTNRFKAAVPENPVTNWASFYGVSDIGPWFAVEELGGRPYEIPEVYARCSPITYAHNCKTPTLLIQGEADYRCPAEQSEQFYTALKASGCIAEMLRLPDSAHAASIMGAPAVRKAQNQALLDWMNRFVLGKTPQAE
ncbi:MAG: S9 family peptidase, partial [Chloroflexi bacterium]|nr:S9 family peptidase [Chloroflexota bacterium]